MTNASLTRMLVRKAMDDAISIPDGGISAQVTAQAAIAHAILDLASAIRELPPITGKALGPVNIDRHGPPEIPDPVPTGPVTNEEEARHNMSLSEKIRKDLAERGR